MLLVDTRITHGGVSRATARSRLRGWLITTAHEPKNTVLRCKHCNHEEIVAWDLVRYVRLDHEEAISMDDIGAELLHTTEVMFRMLHACDYCHFKNHIRDVVNSHQVLCELEFGINRRREEKESV